MSEDEIGQDELAQAHALLADWWNARRGAEEPEYTAEAFADWQAGRREEFLVMAPAGGMSNQLYLVGSGVVRPYSPAYESHEAALEAARGERDGTIQVEPPQPSPF
jgi:hypothetical protein